MSGGYTEFEEIEVTPGQEFWVVAVGCSKSGSGPQEKDTLLRELRAHPALAPAGRKGGAAGPWKFDVPDGERSLMFGSFDNLIRLTDDLQKYDSQVDGVVHRLERQFLEVDPRAEFKVMTQRQVKSVSRYLANWQWDEAKYPKTRSISDNLTLLMSVVNKLDEEARNKMSQYNETKTQRGNLAKKDGATLTNRELIDVVTPEVVQMSGDESSDFVYTEHLTTVCVILARGSEMEFLKQYETFSSMVVPMSAKKFQGLDDKDGNSLWRVVMFKTAVEEFKKACRERRYVARDFEYSEDAYKQLKIQREQIDESVKKQLSQVRGLYSAAWSDAMVAWVHVKAMRVFVESVLRFGMPPRFASFIVMPKAATQQQARKGLADVLGKQGQALGAAGGDKMADAQDDGDEYFPYVSFAFTPFTVPRS